MESIRIFKFYFSRKQLLNDATSIDNEHVITKVESESRIINVGLVTSLILMICSMVLIGTWLIGAHVHSSSTNTINSFPSTQKLYVIYTNGLVLHFQLTKNMQFQELTSQKFPNNKYGHFGFYDIDKLFAFVGSENKMGYYLQDSLIKPIDG